MVSSLPIGMLNWFLRFQLGVTKSIGLPTGLPIGSNWSKENIPNWESPSISLTEICIHIHISVKKMSEKF
uniref:Putative secreted protein n=1 Tax=Amblyomma triste TaxID=251400 RepID=A0A023FZN3_AMBTT